MTVQEQLEKLIGSFDIPGLSLATLSCHRDTVYISAGFESFAPSNNRRRVSKKTLFQLGSVSKLITSCLVVELAKQQELDLFEPLSWPVSSHAADSISLSMLLQHLGGFTDSFGFCGLDRDASTSLANNECDHCFDYWSSNKINEYNYSGCGYWMIQQLLEKRFGCSFSQLLDHWLFLPLGMTQSTCAVTASCLGVASGHDCFTQPLAGGWHQFPDCEAAAGIWSSAEDLSRLIEHLLSPSVDCGLGPRLRWNDLVVDEKKFGYHYGLIRRKYKSRVLYSHTGINPGYQSYVHIEPDRGAALLLLSNKEDLKELPSLLVNLSI